MKANKIIALGIVLLISNSMVVKSEVSNKTIRPIFVRSDKAHQEFITDVEKEPSDEEILSGHQFSSSVNEYTAHGLPKFRPQKESLGDIREYYNRWATVDRQGAASEFKPKKQV